MKFIITRPLESCGDFLNDKRFIFLPAFKYIDCENNVNFSDNASFILTSKKASLYCIKHAFSSKAKYYCVGKETALPLIEEKFQNVFYPKIHNVEALFKLIVNKSVGGEQYVYLSGEIIKTLIDERLVKYNLQCSRQIVYKTQGIYHPLSKIFLAGEKYTFVFYSLQSYHFFIENMKKENVLDLCAQSTIFFILPTRTKEFVLSKINGIEWMRYKIFSNTKEFLRDLRGAIS